MSRDSQFSCIRSEGGLLPPDLLARVADRDSDLEGMASTDYGLLPSERLNEGVTRAWNRMVGAWEAFKDQRSSLGAGDGAVELTRKRWLLPLLSELGFGVLPPTKARDLDGKAYPISHEWADTVPMHLLGIGVDLDRRTPGVAGAATVSPHGLVQEYLNRSDDHLWAIVTNGLRLRILRDNVALTRQSYLEFDLEQMFEGQEYADFTVLWLIGHASRFEGDPPEKCLLERWKEDAVQRGTRALDRLRVGVQEALEALGDGALAHPANTELRERLRAGETTKDDLYRQLLRTIYRLLFLLVAERRDLLHPPGAEPTAVARYRDHYSVERLRQLAEGSRGSPHADLWAGLRVVFGGLSSTSGVPALALPALGSFLWSSETTPDLDRAEIDNRHLLKAIRALCWTRQGRIRRSVDYRNLGSEELGSIYESLLELVPDADASARTFRLATAPGNERKTSGSYYTPSSLIAQILDDALDPVLDEAVGDKPPDEAEQGILAMTVCDPACGSAHFLVAAAHRMAKRLAAVRTGDPEPSPIETQQALRDVVSHCIYGVDVNPMAIELAKVSLWLECHVPGQPLTFLDHHLKCGNSLLGIHEPTLTSWDPTLAESQRGGIPDSAFKVLNGDDKSAVDGFKRSNRQLRQYGAQTSLSFTGQSSQDVVIEALADEFLAVDVLTDESILALEKKQRAWASLEENTERQRLQMAADAWCASFTCLKTNQVSTSRTQHPWDVYYACHRGQVLPEDNSGVLAVREEAHRHRFFHWFIEFPEVHVRGGFSALVGNPPWERVKLKEKQWFASRDPTIARTSDKASRMKLIDDLYCAPAGTVEHSLALEWSAALRSAGAEAHLMRAGQFPFGAVGDVNVYAVFADLFRQMMSETGRAGFICPTGLAVGATYAEFFRHLVQERSVATFYSFENEELLFPEVHHETKFALVTLTGRARPSQSIALTGYLRQPQDIGDQSRRYVLTPEDVEKINPNTGTAPLYRKSYDASVVAKIHRAAGPLVLDRDDRKVDPWRIRFHTRLFHMSEDADVLVRADLLSGEPATPQFDPLYEGKMVWLYDHRYGTYEGQTKAQANQGVLPHVGEEHASPDFEITPRYFVEHSEFVHAIESYWSKEWLLVWRDVGPKERTMIASIIPAVPVGNSMVVGFPQTLGALGAALLLSNLASLCCDYALRQRGNRMSLATVQQAPIFSPEVFEGPCPWFGNESLIDFVVPRVVELVYTSRSLESFGQECGFAGPPFRWHESRRAELTAELDALYCHLYGLGRSDVEWVIDSFDVLRRYEVRPEERGGHGEFRTELLVLERYDAMAEAIESGGLYETPLSPPPADDSMRHRG